MRGDADRAKLRKDDRTVRHDLGELNGRDAPDDFLRSERAFSRSAPDVYAVRIQHDNPKVQSFELFAQAVERHFIIRCDQHGGGCVRLADAV
ncbi:hypothetical protein SDC9_48364 [bioreactor metagenome]|uniref:Uncharacterized protein n=1 Tax=bioreactor metagenome TaxID=1076179 RepID=A0A644WEU4_9ZZZZ